MTIHRDSFDNGGEQDADATAAEFFRRHNRQGARGFSCPPAELLRAFRAQTLSPVLQEHVGRHVARCAMCQMLADALDDTSIDLAADEHDRILARVRARIGPATRTSGSWWPLMAAAAVVGVLGTTVVMWLSNVGPGGTPDASVLHLDKPDVRLPQRPTDNLQGGSPNTAPVEELSTALEPYRADDLEEATRRLAAVVGRFPSDGTAQFYLGVTQLLVASRTPPANAVNRYAHAVAALEAAERLVVDRELAHETSWYLALAYERTGQRQPASEKLRLLCRDGGTRAGQACAGLGELAETSTLPPPLLPPVK